MDVLVSVLVIMSSIELDERGITYSLDMSVYDART